MNRKLYKARREKMLDGVCAGIAHYFGLDPTLVRLAWVLFTAMGGSGIVAYVICAVVMPAEPENL